MMMKPFWVIWTPHAGVYSEKDKFTSEKEAIAKAEALAERHKGCDFWVLRSVAHSIVSTVTTTRVDK